DVLEAGRIPATGLGVRRRIGVCVLDGRDPVGELLIRPARGALTSHIAHLRQVRDARGSLEETDRGDLGTYRRAVLVHIQGRAGVTRVPGGIPRLIAGSGVEGTALLVIALCGRKVKALANTHLVREHVPGDGV